MKYGKRVMGALALSLLFGCQASASTDMENGVTIGVMTYNPDDSQTVAFAIICRTIWEMRLMQNLSTQMLPTHRKRKQSLSNSFMIWGFRE